MRASSKRSFFRFEFNKGVMFAWVLGLAMAYVFDAKSEALDIGPRLISRNLLEKSNHELRPYLTDPVVKRRLHNWLVHPDIRDFVVDCQFNFRHIFQSENIIGPLCYFLRQDDPGRRAHALSFVDRYYFEVQLALSELSEDPRFSSADQIRAQNILSKFTQSDLGKIHTCFDPAMKTQYPKDGTFPYSPFHAVVSCLRKDLPLVDGRVFFGLNLPSMFRNHPGHSVSSTGWIKGNNVTYLTSNDVSESMITLMETKHGLVDRLYPLNGRGSFEAMKAADPKTVFTVDEGFFNPSKDPVWTQPGGIFRELWASIHSATSTIFVDIFFLGGTMGASFAHEIISLLEAKPELKVFILRDNENHFGHKAEMLPIFNFLLSYSFHHPDRLIISGSHIQEHRSGLPSFLAPLISDAFLEKSGIQNHLSLYGRAVSDHSKVMVVDGDTPHPVAFVGSKNWTNTSGAICFDEVAKIEGPAAAVVLDDYYYDMRASLLHEHPFLDRLASQGWSKSSYKTGQTPKEMARNILQPFDILKRNSPANTPTIQHWEVEVKGSVVVRTGFNNVDSTRTNAVDQVLQMILAAQNHIRISDQFLFDRNVVRALIRMKRERPQLKIRVILEPLEVANPPGMPNLLYMDEMADAGIEIKWKKIRGGEHVNQEYHMKTISADGKFLITGSANKDQTTMYGSFREEQVDMYDTSPSGPVATHDQVFDSRWNDSKETSQVFKEYDFKVPGDLKGLNGQPWTPREFVQFVRNIVSILFESTYL